MKRQTKGEQIVALNAQGVDHGEIAKRVGSTIGSVQTIVSRAKKRRKVCAEITRHSFGVLQAAASRRGVAPAQLASRILETVAHDNLISAVLDE
jgi:hypothetical protein